MAQIISYKSLRGLDKNSNPFVGAPNKDLYGSAQRTATVIASNAVQTRQRMIGNRRGFDYFLDVADRATWDDPVDAMFEYQNHLIEHFNTGQLAWVDPADSTTTTAYSGTFMPPTGSRMDGAVSRGSLFFTSSAGIKKIDKYTDNPITAGITKGLDVRATTSGTGNGFMNGFSKCAYHVTWLRTDANNQQVRSDVSTRLIVTNNTRLTLVSLASGGGTAVATTATDHGFSIGDLILISGADQAAYNGLVTIGVTGTTTFTYSVAGSPTSPATTSTTLTAEKAMDVALTFMVPWDFKTGDSYEVWRTVTVDASSADPGDTCYLVSRVINTNSAGATVTFTDTVPDVNLQTSAALYTNATEEGALQGNAKPPFATCLTDYKDYAIYGNTALDHQISLELLAVVNLVVTTSTVTITNADATSRTYVCANTESGLNWQLFTGGLSNASNIEQTTRSLCHAICADASGSWYAEYTSGLNDNPGLFRVWARSPTTGSFTVSGSNTLTDDQFSPVLPATSSNDARPNRLFYGKYQQPDAVPILNTIDVGRLDEPILRVLSVRDALYVIKTDGVYFLNGQVAPFTLNELDTTCRCVAANTAVTLNNQVFMLSTQGIVKISSSGVTVLSYDIESPIMDQALPLPNLSTVAFAVAHESDRHYYLWLPTTSNATTCDICWCFHNFSSEWTSWNKRASVGLVVNSNYALYIQSGIETALLKQRRSGDSTDYSDETLAITIAKLPADHTRISVTWSAGLFAPVIGMTLHQGDLMAKVIAVEPSPLVFKLDRDPSVFSNGAATVRLPITTHIRCSPNVLGEVGLSKSIYSVGFQLEAETVSMATMEVATNEAAFMQSFVVNRTLPTNLTDNPARTIQWIIDMPVPDVTGEAVTVGWTHSVSEEQFVIAQVIFVFDPLGEYVTTR